ncbi:MAG: hypothetical protein ACYC6L_06810 [Anaerolineae bacterium]
MSDVIARVEAELAAASLRFTRKPLLIGGMAMEYYGLRKSGPDIDLVICDADYQALAAAYPDKRKDIWGDLGVVLGPFEIWRCIRLLDYEFYRADAADAGSVLVASLDRLLLMRVFGRQIPKYQADLQLIENYYCSTYTNPAYLAYMQAHLASYQQGDGTIWGGEYLK